MSGPPLGAHVSTAGGVERAIGRGLELGCEAIQIFVKSPNQWAARALDHGAAARFRRRRAESGIRTVAAHAAYLINLAATDRHTLERSRRALGDELDRCHRLGVDYLVVHPGAHMGAGEEAGIDLAANSLRQVLARRPRCRTRLLLELTAGQGTVLGHRLEQLAEIRRRSGVARRLGVCVDTCHAFAAGYGLDRKRGYDRFWRRLDDLLGLGHLGCLHLNDSRHRRGSRRDRHANLTRGEIGRALFRRLVRDPDLEDVPMILETPRGEDGSGHARDLALLRRWRR